MAVSIKAELELEITKLRANAEKAERLIGKMATDAALHTNRLHSTMTRMVTGGFQGVRSVVSQVAGVIADFSANALRMATNSLLGMGIAAGIAATGLTAMGGVAVHTAVNAAAEFEQTRLSIAQFVGGLEDADGILRQISDYAVVTPFETKDLESTTAGLLAAGVAADQVVQVVKELAGVSKDGQQLQELGDALGKGFAKGKYSLEEINKFLERQINLLPALSAVTGLYGAELTKSISAGEIGFVEMEQAIGSMTEAGGQFFGLLEKQSRTGIGLLSTLQSNVQEIYRAFGAPVLNSLKPALEDLISLANQGISFAREFGDEAAKAAAFAAAALNVLTTEQDLAGLGNAMKALFTEATRALGVGLLQAADEFGKALRVAMTHLADPTIEKGIGVIDRALAKKQSFWGTFALQASQWAVAHGMPGLGDKFLEVSNQLHAQAVALDEIGFNRQNSRIAKMGPLETGARAFADAATDPKIGQTFQEGVASTWRLHMDGIKNEIARMQEFVAEVTNRARQNAPFTEPKQETFDNQPATGVAPVETDAAAGEDPARPARKIVLGALGSAVNLIMGRSAQELILDEAKVQTREMQRMNRTLDRIERKNPPAPKIPAPRRGVFTD